MKFGKQIKRLADPTYLNHCLAYDVLKKAINVVVVTEQSPQEQLASDINVDIRAVNEVFGKTTNALNSYMRPPDSRFHELLQHELAKVNRFAALQIRTLIDTVREASSPLLVSSGRAPKLDAEALLAAERQLDSVAEDLVKLEQFRRLNFTGFRKIVKNFDKRSSDAGTDQGPIGAWFVPHLLREFFVAASFDPLILALAWGYSALRRHRRGIDAATSMVRPEAPADTDGTLGPATTNVYLLMPYARTRVLCTLVKRFEVVLPPAPAAGKDVEGAVAHTATTVEQQRRLVLAMTPEGRVRMPRLSREVSMVYHDAPAFPLYRQRLERPDGPGPAGFRLRRATSNDRQHDRVGSDLVERDGTVLALSRHAFTPVSRLQSSDAFPCGAATASALRDAAAAALAGDDRIEGFAREVADAARNEDLQPMATVGSARVLLRGDAAGTTGISIALDEDVQFSRGPAGPAVTAPSDAIDFPYCFLEVANANADSGDDSWLGEVRGFAAIRTIAGFSTGAHAVAALHRDAVPELPHWFEHLAMVQGSAPSEAWGLTLEWRQAWEEAMSACEVPKSGEDTFVLPVEPSSVGSAVRPTAPLVAPQNPMQRLEPKNFLASERTMLEWMHTVIALAFLGVGLRRVSFSSVVDSEVSPSPAPQLGVTSNAGASGVFLGCYSLALIGIAVAFAWYAVLRHMLRTSALFSEKHTEGVFNDRFGPTALAVAVASVLIFHVVVQVAPLVINIVGGNIDDDATLVNYTLPVALAAT